MVATLLHLSTLREKDDAIDALAIALCASFERSIIG
jgi:Holliday junction resolvasome RuvABC endonuclease subunit